MRISEIFHSIQGEGKLAGMPSVFIRTSGCNLRCTWCDSPYTSWKPDGENVGVERILERVADYACIHVVLTGGEPMLAPDVAALTHALRDGGYHITLETAATIWKDVVCDLASLSPKLAHSTPWTRDGGRWADRHEQRRINMTALRQFIARGDYQLKFVVESPEDLGEIDTILAQIGAYKPANVLLMPQGVTREELDGRSGWIADVCKDRGFRYCPRLQISLFGHTRGT